MPDDPHARGQEPWTSHPPEARDIAITGIGCRFPGGVRDLDDLWQVLIDGLDVTGEVPADRWGPQFFHPDPRHPGTTYCPRGAFLDEVDRFDASFFGISSREACELDPQQRLLLETAWSAIEDSGTPRDALKGSRTGVFAGVLSMDYALLHAKTAGAGRISPYYASGKEFSFGAGRISYTFGLNGPCVMINSACSSSLMAVHLACQALRGGECDAALAGGVNLMLAPELSVFMSKIDALSPSGVCRPFDADADGVVRGEGCGVVMLKRYSDAAAHGDRIWAIIRGSAANHDGRSAGLTAPNAAAQQMLLRAALYAAQVDPADLDYVEAHGTGTPLGDPLEISSLATVIGSARVPGQPLLVGSHKANFGHLDSAAGVLGLLKGVLVARKGVVPPQINLNRPTTAVDWEESGVRVPTAPTPLSGPGPRFIGVNAFGLSGSNAHVVLTTPPTGEPEPAGEPEKTSGPGARLLVLSGPTPEAVTAQADAYRDRLEGSDAADLADLLYSASARRTHHDYRLAVTGESAAELAGALSAHQRDEAGPDIASDDVLGGRPSRVVHVFSGQGSQWPGMAMDLYRSEPVVQESLGECEQIVRDIGGWSILTEIGRTPASRLAETEIAQPAIFAVQLALTRLWASWGLVPDAVLGHSMGEVAAACTAGALGVEDAIRLIVQRGQIMQQASGTGRMTAVELPADEVRTALEPRAGEVCVAAVNGPRSVVIAAVEESMKWAISRLTRAGASCLDLGVDYTFHSPVMRGYGDELEERLAGLRHETPKLTLLSSVDPEATVPVTDAAYWGRNVREPVLFWPAADRLLTEQDVVFIEIGPHPTLARPLRAAMSRRQRRGPVVSSLARGKSGEVTLASALAKLYTAGAGVNWAAVHGPGHRYIALPPLRLGGDSYWIEGVQRGAQGGTLTGLRAEVRIYDEDGHLVATANGDSRRARTGTSGHDGGGAAAPAPEADTASAPDAAAPTPADAAPAPADGPAGDVHSTGGRLERAQAATRVSTIVAELLGHNATTRISRVRGFYELGLDSFTIVQLIRRLQAEFGLELAQSAGIEHPTIDQMTDHLMSVAAAQGTGQPPAEPLPSAAPPGARRTGAPHDLTPPPVSEPTAPDSSPEPIAIVGMSCRFPGASGLDGYWTLLHEGIDATQDVPESRWDAGKLLADGLVRPGTVVTRRGAFIDGIDQFDNAFFRVSAREARSMDPQQRIFLEVAWEALDDAGLSLDRLRSSQTGMFVGMNTTDYQQLVTQRADQVDLYYGTGNSFSGAPGRLSYYLGVRGPSIAVDTACSSSLVAVHLACQSLRAGESDVALAGGVNAMISPTVYLAMSSAGALAPDGRCKTFDAAADGYGRGEGAGAVVLKTLSQARADGDRVYAVIQGSAVNHNGASGGLTVPSAEAQEQVIRTALAQSGTAAAAVGYVEAHGTGTILGDAVELAALDRALGSGRRGHPLLIGSVKTNIGHLEAAAGVAGLIKAVLSIAHGEIPAHLHFATPTGQVAWDKLAVKVAARPTPWPITEDGQPRVAGVSAFGFTGTNAHVVLTGPPAIPYPAPGMARRRPFVLPVSGASEAARHDARQRLAAYLDTLPDDALPDVCFTAGARRAHLEHRLAVVGDSRAELAKRLRAAPGQGDVEGSGIYSGIARAGEPARFALAYGESLADLPWASLDEQETAFRAALDALDKEADAVLGRSVRTALREGRVDRAVVVAAQIALTALWRDHGIVPDAVAGSGVGEIAAACAAGLLSPRDALLAATGASQVRLSAGPTTDLPAPRWYLASLPGADADTGAWQPPAVSRPAPPENSLAARLAAAGIEVVVDAGLGSAAGLLAAQAPEALSAIAVAAPGTGSFIQTAAALHVAGAPVDWETLLARRGHVVSLPAYPWQHRRHWMDSPVRGSGETEAGIHPGLGAALTPADALDRRYYPVGIASGPTVPPIGAPRTLELVLAAAADLLTAGAVRLRGFKMSAPLIDAARLAAGAGAQLAARKADAGWSLQLMPGADAGVRGAFLVATADAERSPQVPHSNLADLRTRTGEPVTAEPGFTAAIVPDVPVLALTEVRQDPQGHERLAVVRQESSGTGSPVLPAALLAAALDLLASCNAQAAPERFAVQAIDEVRAYAAPGLEVFVHATATGTGGGNVRLLNDDGQVLAEFIGVHFTSAASLIVAEAVRNRMSERVYRVDWRPLEDARASEARRGGRWLICPAAEGAQTSASGLAEALRRAGAHATIAPASADGIARMIAGPDPVDGVTLVTAGTEAAGPGRSAGAVLRAAQAIEAARASAPPPLWVVTRGAQDPAGSAVPDAEQAAAWGVGRVLAMEAPALRGGLVDLDPDGDPHGSEDAQTLDAVAARMLCQPPAAAEPTEDELCLRNGIWYAPRLIRGGLSPHTLPPLPVGEDKWYVVAGGSPAVNRPLLGWLTGHGVRRVLLIPQAAPGDDDSGDIIAASASAVAEGTELRVARIGDADPRRDLVAATDGAPVGAVLVTPAPAVIRPLSETTTDHITADLGQTGLVRRLNRALDGDRLAFFCVFGSAAASWGSVGMAARAATEGALDAISADRAAHHWPIQRIRWMPRSDTGELGRRDRMLMEDSGLMPLDAADVAEALDVLVRTGCPEAAVARVDEPRYAAVCRARLNRAFLSQFGRVTGNGDESGDADGPTGSQFAAGLAELSPDAREERVLDFVLEQVVEVLGEEAGNDVDPDQGFFDLGMDSVMSMALKTRLDRTLGGDLSATLAFEFPTTRALARHLLESVNGSTTAAPSPADQSAAGEPPTREDRPEGDTEADYDDLSDDELMDRLMASVGRSRSLLGDE